MAGDKTTLTSREMEVLALAWQCMETQPKINFSKLGALAGYTPASASVTFGNIRRKLKVLSDNATTDAALVAAPTTPKKTPAKSTAATTKSSGKKRGAKTGDGADDGASPSKKRAGGKGKKDGEEDDEEDDEEDFSGQKVKKEEAEGLLFGMEDYLKKF